VSIPVWVLLGFAGWTLATLIGSVGVFRWSRILTGRQQIREFRADEVERSSSDFYKRAMRAHANCVENLPIYGAVVVAIVASGARSLALDVLAVLLLGFRVIHTFVHVAFEQTNVVSSFRFAFYFAQFLILAIMGGLVAAHAS
jgi:uncharacterized MAPEG superfamily protein